MRKAKLDRITAALRKLTPDQRKRVAAELASLDARPASAVVRSNLASKRGAPARSLTVPLRPPLPPANAWSAAYDRRS